MLKRESIPIQSFEWGQAVERIVWKGDDLPQQIDKGMSSAVSLSAPLPQGKSHSRMLEGKYYKTGSVILGPRLSRQSLSPKKGGFVRDRANVIGHTHELGQHRKGVSKAEGPSLQSCVHHCKAPFTSRQSITDVATRLIAGEVCMLRLCTLPTVLLVSTLCLDVWSVRKSPCNALVRVF